MHELKRLRLIRGWTQDKAARELNVSTSAYCNWEKGNKQPHPKRWPQIAKKFGVEPRALTYALDREEPAMAEVAR